MSDLLPRSVCGRPITLLPHKGKIKYTHTCFLEGPCPEKKRDPYPRHRVMDKPADSISTLPVHIDMQQDTKYVRPIFPREEAMRTINNVHPRQLHFGSSAAAVGGGGGQGGLRSRRGRIVSQQEIQFWQNQSLQTTHPVWLTRNSTCLSGGLSHMTQRRRRRKR